ncbi:filament-like plant protein [Trifolium pratense]|uniref:Filament-like plant protein n=1 Tax=Trifolium pratense TaxID=57577 RepID=A0A2K3NT76_TRIPR|nr:filament-like plant protein [Trifolium pratense]
MLFCVDVNVGLVDTMTDKKRWLWKRKSSEKSSGEAESSGSVSSHSERYSDEQEVSKESSNGSSHSPDVTSKAVACAEDVDDSSVMNEQLHDEVALTPLSTCFENGITSEIDKNGDDISVINELLPDRVASTPLSTCIENGGSLEVDKNGDDSSVINEQLPDRVASTPLSTCIENGGSLEVDKNGDNSSVINEQLPDRVALTPLSTCIVNGGSLEVDKNENILNGKEGDRNDGSRDISEKLSAAPVNVNAKEDLVKQHAKVAEEAIAGWEKAENEVANLKKQLGTVTLRNSALEDRVTHLDGALKECVRQLRQTREEHEANIQDAVAEKTHELESDKIKLESKLIELQNKLDASNAKSSIERDMRQKVEWLEKEKMSLRHEILVQSEELKIRTIERDLSTQAAETASKQHLESIKKVAKLEAECRRLKSIASRASLVNDHKSIASSSFCVESLTDSQSDSTDRLTTVDCDIHKMSGSELNRCEPSCSDSWASALIAELDQFKNEKCCRQDPSGSVKIDLMDDFLEMERLAALPETKNESVVEESVVANQCIDKESALRAEFDIMSQQMDELKMKLEKVEADKAELGIALMKSEECIEESRLQLSEAILKLEELQTELEIAYKSKQKLENRLMSMEADTQTLSSKVVSLEADVDKERAVSHKFAMKCKDLEEELENKSAMLGLLEAEVDKERSVLHEIAIKCEGLEEELEGKCAKVDLLEAELVKERIASHEITAKCNDLEEELEGKSAKVNLLEAEVVKERAVSDEIAAKCKDLEKELESESAKVVLLEAEVEKERAMSEEIALKCRELEEEILRPTTNFYGEKKIKQEDLALAAGKLAECQKTIASLGNQLKSLATLEDFLIDTAGIPPSPSLIAHAGGELWKMHSNVTFSPKRDSTSSRLADGSSGPSLNQNEESSPLSSSSSTSSSALPNHASSEKSRNGFAKFFSRTKSGIRLEI